MRKVLFIGFMLICATALIIWSATVTTEETGAELPKEQANPIDGAEMVLIPAGEFIMGTSEEELAAWLKAHPDDKREWFTGEMPQRKVYLDGYYIYKHEVTVAQYRKFCRKTARDMPPKPDWDWHDDHPIVNVSWHDAAAYAAWAGAELPTEAQWEKAARGGDRRVFPWGDAWPPPAGAGNFSDETAKASGKFPYWTFIDSYTDNHIHTSPVGAFTANPYSIHDLAGNVWEWCADWHGEDYYAKAPPRNPSGPAAGAARVVRGGCWFLSFAGRFRAAYRVAGLTVVGTQHLGFRCVVPIDAPAAYEAD